MRKQIGAWLVIALMPMAVFAASPAEQEKAQMQREVAALIAANDFAGVESKAEQDLASASRFSDGLWRASLLYSLFNQQLSMQANDDKHWEAIAASLRSLATRRPKAWLLYVEMLHARAWQVRGSGYASSVKADAWPVFHRYLGEAREVLDSHKKELSALPSWYSLRLTFATETGEGEQTARTIFEEGVKRHPAYHALFFARMRNVSPNWGGGLQQMRQLLEQVAHMPGAVAKEGMYARLVWISDDLGYNLARDASINQQALRESVDTLAERYPDQWNMQKFFFMACERSDKPLAGRMLSKVREPLIQYHWAGNELGYPLCRDWVQGKVASFLFRDHYNGQLREFVVQ